jgi:hypothetical protein
MMFFEPWRLLFIGSSEKWAVFAGLIAFIGGAITLVQSFSAIRIAQPANVAHANRDKPIYEQISEETLSFVKSLSPEQRSQTIHALALILTTTSPVKPYDIAFQARVSETRGVLVMPSTGPWIHQGLLTTHEEVERLIDLGLFKEIALNQQLQNNENLYYKHGFINFQSTQPIQTVVYVATKRARELLFVWQNFLPDNLNLERIRQIQFPTTAIIRIGKVNHVLSESGALNEQYSDVEVFRR